MANKTTIKKKSKSIESPFPRAASLELSLDQGNTFDRQPLNVEVYFDEEDFLYIPNKSQGFTLKFRRCDLSVRLYGADFIKPPLLYRRTLPPENFRHLLQKTMNTHALTGGKVSVGFAKSLTDILATIGLSVNAEAKLERESTTSNKMDINSELRYVIVEPVGAHRWRIGHELLGDPTKIDGALHGDYFRERADDRGQENTSEGELSSLGVIRPHNGRRKIKIILDLRARFKHCMFLPFGDDYKNTGDWHEENRKKAEKLIILRSVHDDQKKAGNVLAIDEFIVCRLAVELVEKDAIAEN